ncbi:hypothetical protein JVT61DRAFT_4267 [Boletus reticuloceps]|uniref:Uncharacterized protein n=1 Tax=Boletus reticuloceps TaxID=495285 RepID=A0A8I2YMD1_9AGAM|nr:hypothetical protein JVT61DRAFT_4267 [Boletus reticuloceps]
MSATISECGSYASPILTYYSSRGPGYQFEPASDVTNSFLRAKWLLRKTPQPLLPASSGDEVGHVPIDANTIATQQSDPATLQFPLGTEDADASDIEESVDLTELTSVCRNVINAIEMNVDKEHQEFSGISQDEYVTLVTLIEEDFLQLMRVPKLTYLANQKFLIVHMPSSIHEALVTEFHAMLILFQQAEYPRSLVCIHATANTDVEKETISAVPNFTLVFSTLKQPKICHNSFILEAAFTQTASAVFKKVKGLIDTCPEVLMVVIILIDEKDNYHSPVEGFPVWEKFKQDHHILGVEEFVSMADSSAEAVVEPCMAPVVVGAHTWTYIDHVDYYIWLKKPPADGVPGDVKITINAENIEQTDWSAHGIHLELNTTPRFV